MKRTRLIILIVLILIMAAVIAFRIFGSGEYIAPLFSGNKLAGGDSQQDILSASESSDSETELGSSDSSSDPVPTLTPQGEVDNEEEDYVEVRGEDYSPIVDEYVVELQPDEAFEIG